MAAEAREVCLRIGHEALLWAADYELALVAAVRGDRTTATALSESLFRWATPRRAHTVAAYAHHAEMLSTLARGDFEMAYHHARVISPAGEFTPHASLGFSVAMDLVESAVRTGRTDLARAHVRAMAQTEMVRLSPRLALLYHASEALVADGDTVREHFERALAVPGAARYRFDLARVELLYGSHLRRHQAVASSRAHLRRALAMFDELGAAPWSARTRAELSATAETRAPARAQVSGELTPQELEIAELAASGMTNKKIAERLAISPRTVGNHLYRAYPKLGIGSRGGLRDALRARLVTS